MSAAKSIGRLRVPDVCLNVGARRTQTLHHRCVARIARAVQRRHRVNIPCLIGFRSCLQEVAHHERVTSTRGLKRGRLPCNVSSVFVRTRVTQKLHDLSVPSDRSDDQRR